MDDRVKELECQIKQHEQQVAAWKEQVASQMQRASAKIATLTAEKEELKALSEKVAMEAGLKTRLMLTKEFNERAAESERQSSLEIASLKSEIASLQERLKTEVGNLQERLRVEENRVADMVSQRATSTGSEEQVTTLQAILVSTKNELKRYQLASAQYADSMKELQSTSTKQQEELQGTLRHKVMQLEMAQKRVLELENINKELLAVNAELREENKERESAMNVFFQTQHKDVFLGLQKESDELTKKCAKLVAETKRKDDIITELHAQIEALRSENDDLRETANSATITVDRAKQRAADAETRLRDAYREITQLKLSSQSTVNKIPSVGGGAQNLSSSPMTNAPVSSGGGAGVKDDLMSRLTQLKVNWKR
eukprot:PhF_6_TR6079/c0_g1_i2/m.8859